MISAIRQFFADLSGDTQPKPQSEDELRLAAAALLFHVVAIDGTVSDAERARLRALLMERFGLDAADTDTLIAEAEAADKQAVDLYGFTSVLKRKLDAAERERVIEMMWELVFADGTVHEFEDNLVWRAAELLGVGSQVRIRLKQTVRRHAGA